MIKLATGCTGIGSPEEALKNLNEPHEIVFACEKDKFARETYLANHKPKAMYHDMTKEEFDQPDQYSDLFIAGIPCQAFSLAGKRLGELDKRGLLIYDFYRYVKRQKPKAFLLENVKGLLSHDKGRTFINWCDILGRSLNGTINMFKHEESLEYNLHYRVLNTRMFGLPQNRERIFLIGIRKDLEHTYVWPKGFKLNKKVSDFLEPEVNDKYYLSEKMIRGLLQHQENSEEKGRGFKFEPMTLDSTKPAKCIRHNCHKMGPDDNYIIQSARIAGRNPENPKSRLSGLDTKQHLEINEDPSVINALSTVTKDNVLMFSDKVIRRPTPLECFRLQGFPDEFIKPVSDTQLYMQAGNTISVPVIQAVIKNLLHIIR